MGVEMAASSCADVTDATGKCPKRSVTLRRMQVRLALLLALNGEGRESRKCSATSLSGDDALIVIFAGLFFFFIFVCFVCDRQNSCMTAFQVRGGAGLLLHSIPLSRHASAHRIFGRVNR